MTKAVVQVSLGGGAPASGGLVASFGQTVAITATDTSGWTQALWTLVDYPPGMGVPSGWTTAANGTYVFNPPNPTTPPPTFTLPASGALNWGKIPIRLQVNGNPVATLPNGAPSPGYNPALTDTATILSILSPHLAMPGIAAGESTQFDVMRSWTGPLMAALRLADTTSGGGGGVVAPIFFSALASLAPTATRQVQFIDAYAVEGDGGGGFFAWDAAGTQTPDGGTIVQVTGITTGRWVRIFSGPMNGAWFGMSTSGSASQTAFNSMVSACITDNFSAYIPGGTYTFTASISIPAALTLLGDPLHTALFFSGATNGGVLVGGTPGSGTFSVMGRVHGVTFEGNGSSSLCGLNVNNVQSGHVQKCGFLSWEQEGLLFLDTILMRASDNIVTQCGTATGTGRGGAIGYAALAVDSANVNGSHAGSGSTTFFLDNTNCTNNVNAAAGMRFDRTGPITVIGGTSEGSKGPLVQIGASTESTNGCSAIFFSGIDLEEASVATGSDHFVDIGYGLAGTAQARCSTIVLRDCTILNDTGTMTYGIKVKNTDAFRISNSSMSVGAFNETTTIAYLWFELLSNTNMSYDQMVFDNEFIPPVAVNTVVDASAIGGQNWSYAPQSIGGGIFSGSGFTQPIAIPTPATPQTGWVEYVDRKDGNLKAKCSQGGVVTLATQTAFSSTSLQNTFADWDASSLSAGGISSWTDIVNGRTLLQASGGNQPTWSSNTAPNSLPCVVCNGTTDFLQLLGISLPMPFSWWIVAKFTSAGTSGTMVDGAAANQGRVYRTADTQWDVDTGVGHNSYSVGTTAAWHAYGAICGAGANASAGWVDSAGAVTVSSFLSANTLTGITVGQAGTSGDFAAFSVAKIIICADAFSAADISSLKSFGAFQYGL